MVWDGWNDLKAARELHKEGSKKHGLEHGRKVNFEGDPGSRQWSLKESAEDESRTSSSRWAIHRGINGSRFLLEQHM
jgi:hypothetical protein